MIWGILSHSSRRAFSSSWRVGGGGWWPATRLPRASQTCSIGFMSGEHAGYSIRTIPSSKRSSSTKLARCGQQLSSIKMKSSPIAAAIIPTATVPPDENTPIIRMNRKMGLVRKKEHCSIHFFSSLHALLPTPCGRYDALMLV
ncbi:hypothetical protein TNCV_4347151 [Trichonephila clavipes]|nr:hypothetical protein TNCV_4347151 [Trichonephila clavipes]